MSEVLCVGGERHGTTMDIEGGWLNYFDPGGVDYTDRSVEVELSLPMVIITLQVQKATGIFPGRTDRQPFRFVKFPDGYTVLRGTARGIESDPVDTRLADAALIAWSNGWTP